MLGKFLGAVLLLLLVVVNGPVPMLWADQPSSTDSNHWEMDAPDALDQVVQDLFTYLTAEWRASQGQLKHSAMDLATLAQRTQNVILTRRAGEIAYQAGLHRLALKMVWQWNQLAAQDVVAQQAYVGMLLTLGEYDTLLAFAKYLFRQDLAGPSSVLSYLSKGFSVENGKAYVDFLSQLEAQLPQMAALRGFKIYLIEMMLWAQQPEKALVRINRFKKAEGPLGPALVILEARAQFKQQPQAALAGLVSYLKKKPRDEAVRLALIRLQMLAGHQEAALRNLVVLMEKRPQDAELRYNAAILRYEQKQYDDAKAYLRDALYLGPKNLTAVLLALGDISVEQGLLQEAEQYYQEIADERLLFSGLSRLLLAYLDQDSSGVAARKFLHQAKQKWPNLQPKLRLAELSLLRKLQDHVAVYALLEQMPEQDKTVDLQYEQALAAEKLGRFDLFEQQLRGILKSHPEYAHAYNALGYSFADRNVNLQEAQQLILVALSLQPESPMIIDSAGWVAYRLKDYALAQQRLSQAFSLLPDPEIGLHWVSVLLEMGRLDEARVVIEKVTQQAPNSALLKQMRDLLQQKLELTTVDVQDD